MTSSKNLVLAFATNIKSDRLKVLSQSLREVYSPQECDLVIYINKVSDDLASLSQDYSIEWVHTENAYSYDVTSLSKLLSRLLIYSAYILSKVSKFSSSLKFVFQSAYPSLFKLWYHPQIVRWLYYRDYVKNHRNYKKILMADVKDVIFQAPFFDFIDEQYLYGTEQGREYSSSSNNIDTRWYRSAYGSKQLKKIEGKPALCCATVLGGFQPVERFLDDYCSKILEMPLQKATDQAIFNHVFYTQSNSIGITRTFTNSGSPTLHAIGPKAIEGFKVTDNGVLTKEGSLVPLIHGWDRTKVIFEYVAKKFELDGEKGYAGGYIKR
jgi:hypothetical protein